MVGKLLITLREGDVTRSFTFDGSAQTALWLGMARKVSADNALAHLESEGDALTLYPVGIGKSKARGKGIPVPPLAEFVTSIERPGERTVYFFSRPVLKGMGTYRKLGFSDSVSFIVGRSQGSGFLYESPFVSSQHARIEYADGAFTLTDLDSSNGTIINGQPLAPLQPRWLKVGDVVQILDLVFVVGQGFLSINTPPRFTVKVPGVAFVTHQTILDAWADVERRGYGQLFFVPKDGRYVLVSVAAHLLGYIKALEPALYLARNGRVDLGVAIRDKSLVASRLHASSLLRLQEHHNQSPTHMSTKGILPF